MADVAGEAEGEVAVRGVLGDGDREESFDRFAGAGDRGWRVDSEIKNRLGGLEAHVEAAGRATACQPKLDGLARATRFALDGERAVRRATFSVTADLLGQIAAVPRAAFATTRAASRTVAAFAVTAHAAATRNIRGGAARLCPFATGAFAATGRYAATGVLTARATRFGLGGTTSSVATFAIATTLLTRCAAGVVATGFYFLRTAFIAAAKSATAQAVATRLRAFRAAFAVTADRSHFGVVAADGDEGYGRAFLRTQFGLAVDVEDVQTRRSTRQYIDRELVLLRLGPAGSFVGKVNVEPRNALFQLQIQPIALRIAGRGERERDRRAWTALRAIHGKIASGRLADRTVATGHATDAADFRFLTAGIAATFLWRAALTAATLLIRFATVALATDFPFFAAKLIPANGVLISATGDAALQLVERTAHAIQAVFQSQIPVKANAIMLTRTTIALAAGTVITAALPYATMLIAGATVGSTVSATLLIERAANVVVMAALLIFRTGTAIGIVAALSFAAVTDAAIPRIFATLVPAADLLIRTTEPVPGPVGTAMSRTGATWVVDRRTAA